MPENPQNYVWAWFKPINSPDGLIVRFPDELYRRHPQLAGQWTMRRLLQAAGIEPPVMLRWFLYGIPFEGMNGTTPYLDARIPPAAPGVDPNILVCMHPAMPPMELLPQSIPPIPPIADATTAELFERIDADWTAALELEREVARFRKQLVDAMSRLKNMNRDLSGPERLHSNSQDKKDWQDARRGLRNGAIRLWKCIKAHDIGDTSYAGQRAWFEETYEKFIAPRKMFEQVHEAGRAFAAYRKMLQALYTDMHNAHSNATLDGERKAQQVLSRITQKVREASSKKNFLGLMLD